MGSKRAKASPSRTRNGPAKRGKPGRTGRIIDRIYRANAEGLSRPTATAINWYGQFSDELPKPFCLKRGGHGWLLARDLEHAATLVGKLRTWVLARKVEPDLALDLGFVNTKEWA